MTATEPITCTIPEWMEIGPQAVRDGAVGVRITDRTPDAVSDRITPHGAFGWMYGCGWLEHEYPHHRWTLPQCIFRELPPCPYPEVEEERKAGRGIEPRWPVPDEARDALNRAAFRWAKKAAKKCKGGPK